MTAPDIRIFGSDELAATAAEQIAAHISAVIAERGCCRVGLAGGATPKPVYEKLAALSVAWDEVKLLWGDERCVPPEHDDSNYKMAHAALLGRVAIPAENVHRIAGELPQNEAARAYAAVLGAEPIDILLLGMGDDGHTASLFPGRADLSSSERVIAATSPLAPHDRVTLTIRAINESRAVYFLISGADKAEPLAEVQTQIERGEPVLPAAHVQPASGRLIWMIDRAAANNLKRPNHKGIDA